VNIRVCGSVARGEARPDSDIDLVVDMDDNRDVLDLVELVLDLEEELGRRVDVLAMSRGRPPSRYSPVYAIVADAVPITAAPPPRCLGFLLTMTGDCCRSCASQSPSSDRMRTVVRPRS